MSRMTTSEIALSLYLATGPRVLVACEYSCRVRDAFAAVGCEAWSCDLLPAEVSGQHYQGDVFDIIGLGWDALIAFPPCTYLAASGMHWTRRGLRDPQLTEDALRFVERLMDADVPHISVENPIGAISSRIRKPDQVVHPWWFGDDASKSTCLWLKGLTPLRKTKVVPGRCVIDVNGNVRERWANQLDSGQNRLPPSDDRWKERSRTYPGLALAMATQWGEELR